MKLNPELLTVVSFDVGQDDLLYPDAVVSSNDPHYTVADVWPSC